MLDNHVYHIDDYIDKRTRPVKQIVKNLRSRSSADSDWPRSEVSASDSGDSDPSPGLEIRRLS